MMERRVEGCSKTNLFYYNILDIPTIFSFFVDDYFLEQGFLFAAVYGVFIPQTWVDFSFHCCEIGSDFWNPQWNPTSYARFLRCLLLQDFFDMCRAERRQ